MNQIVPGVMQKKRSGSIPWNEKKFPRLRDKKTEVNLKGLLNPFFLKMSIQYLKL